MGKTRTITPNDPADFTPEMGNYKTLQPFRYWCQKVLPLVYDDSLSYYELLCKVVDYLNKTMEDVETLHGDVTNLHKAYVQLQTYVNNYFSTLDVQEEINNKLNGMAKDGTLSQLIAPFITANANPIFVDSVRDMKDHNKTYVLTSNGHVYVYRNGSFVDTGMIYDFNNKDFILVNAGFDIDDDYLTANTDVNITTLDINTFYRVVNITQEHALQLGLKDGMGTVGSLYITKPYPKNSTGQSFKLIEWFTGNNNRTRIYYTYLYGGETVDTIVWHTVANVSDVDNAVNNSIICDAGYQISDEYLTKNPNTNVLTLTPNTYYRVDNLTPEHYDQLGFTPDMRNPGNLYITRPYKRNNQSLTYTLIEYTTGNLQNSRKYFAFLYGNETLNDIKWNNVVDTEYLDNAPNTIIVSSGFDINDDYLTKNPDVNVTTLTTNTFYRVINITQEHALQLGLKEEMGTVGSLYITKPYKRTVTGQQFKLIEWFTGNNNKTRRYYTYLYGNETVDTLVWHTVANVSDVDNAVNNSIICDAGYQISDEYLTNNPNTNVLTLTPNTYYRVDNLTPEHYDQLGFTPDMRNPGNLYITRPYKRNNQSLTYTLIEYTTGNLQNSRKYFAFLYGNETLNDIFWKKVETTGLKKITNLADSKNVIYLIGDSIVEGYGGTGYNGGSSSNHSNEEIPNNVKTWYRNTAGTCWANMFKSYVESNYPNTKVINNGIGGLTCAQVDDNFNTLVGNDATMVIISCGTNDRNNSSKNSAITSHIKNMVRKANMRGLKCVVLTNTPLRTGVVSDRNNAQTINAYINNAIEQTDTFYVEVLSEMLSYMELNNLSINDVTTDDLHPNDLGYKIMFNIIRAKLGL